MNSSPVRDADDPVRVRGRVLYLSSRPGIVPSQLEGRDLTLAECLTLRDNVSTDEITPTTVMLNYDDRLGRVAHIGFKVGDEQPIGRDAVRSGGFEVIVAGKRYGKGSSRESSPLAEKSAGIRLIVAESFERIYRQNCDNLGLLTTSDFSVLDRIAAGEAIPIEFFLQGRDETTQRILRVGGLLRYSRAHLPRSRERHVGSLPDDGRPRTLAEKIIAQRKVAPAGDAKAGDGVFLSADWRFSHDYFTGMCAHFMHEAFGDDVDVVRPQEIVAFKDHLVLARQSAPHVRNDLVAGVDELFAAHDRFVSRYGVREHGTIPGEPGSEGICHALMAERHALPGQVVVGTDSHTPHSGALGCLAFGAGATDIANSWVTGLIRCRIPETIRVELDGELADDVMARDVVAYLLQTELVRSGAAIGAVFEFAGRVVERMSMDERATLTNMVAEMGGFSGIVAPDETTLAFLRQRRGIDVTIESWMRSDPGATYRDVLHVDCSALPPMVARPGDPGNALPLSGLDRTVSVDIALGGSCTSGKRADFDAYHAVLKWALERKLRISPRTRMYLQYGTRGVQDHCRERGYLATFEAMGVELISAGCGACANCGPGQSTDASQVSVSSINRNFPGRSGPGSVWLASPYTVAASAICGRLASFGELRDLVARGELRRS